MRRMRRFILPLVALFVMLASATLSHASVVTIDIPGKTVKSDSSTFETKRLRIRNGQYGAFAMNTTLTPQSFTLKVNGLPGENYDVYINDAKKWTKSTRELEAGVAIDVDGRMIDSSLIKSINLIKGQVDAERQKLLGSSESEAGRISATLSQASDWCDSAIQADLAWRSATVILVPTGDTKLEMTWYTRETAAGTVQAFADSCHLMQQARARMSHVIEDADLRNETVASMTPIDFTATYTTENGKPHIEAKLVNNCDLPVSGSVSMALPKGWKTTAKKLSFKGIKCGQTFAVSFDLLAPSKSAVAPTSVPMAANVSLVQDIYTANCKFRTTAQK